MFKVLFSGLSTLIPFLSPYYNLFTVFIYFCLHICPHFIPLYTECKEIYVKRSVIDRWVQSDHILLIHPCPEKLSFGTKGHKISGMMHKFEGMLSLFYLEKLLKMATPEFIAGCQVIGPPRTIHLLPKVSSKYSTYDISAVCCGAIMLKPITWPPRSPDLTPLDFFLWGYMQSLVYEISVETQHVLVARIVTAAEKVKYRESFKEFSIT
jgi:hypothetical protein